MGGQKTHNFVHKKQVAQNGTHKWTVIWDGVKDCYKCV